MKTATALFLAACAAALAVPALADTTPQALPFFQDWTNVNLITTLNDWSGVPGIIGYRGDDLNTTINVDPEIVLADGSLTPINLNPQGNPCTFISGGNLEDDGLANPVVSFQGSGTADEPHMVLYLNTTGWVNIRVQYDLRDVDCSTDTTKQQVALHYRVGGSGSYTNVPAAYVANASSQTPTDASKSTHVDITLPAACDNQPLINVRWMTANAFSNDQEIGVDNIAITGEAPTAARPASWGKVKSIYRN